MSMGELRKNSKTACLILGVSCLVAAGCLAFPSFAWFAKAKTAAEADSISGSSTSAYFKGKGTASEPYLIEGEKQLYYFNWLQDLGYFNGKDGDGQINQIYFSLEKDLDMANYVLPPAGTKAYPFLGNFKGNDHVIKNLRISNSLSEVTQKPSNAKDDDGDGLLDDAEIVGFFGIVGEWANGEAYKFDTKINAVSGLYFDKLEITSQATSTLAGLLAGYVNGAMSNCAVRSGNITYASGAKPLQNSVFGTDNDKLSKYSLIGDYNSETFAWEGKPGGGQDNDWGGSIDIKNLDRRVYEISKNKNTTSKKDTGYSTYTNYENSEFNAYISSNNINYENIANAAVVTFYDGSFIPLNVNLDDIDSYSTADSETVLSTNTGYLVGSGSTYNGTPRIRRRNFAKTEDGSGFSLRNFIVNESSITDSNVSFLYFDSINKTTYRITNPEGANEPTDSFAKKTYSELGLKKYEYTKDGKTVGVRSDVVDMVKSDKTSIDLHMVMFSRLSSLQKATKSGLTMNGKSNQTLDFYKGGLNFHLNTDGIATVVMATTRSTSNASFFDLYSYTRGNDGLIDGDATKITKVYRDSSGNYSYTNTGSSTLLVDLDAMSTSLVPNSVYYQEIPLKSGDYFLSDVNNGYSPYFLYLDIGANANGDSGDTGGTPDIDFTYYSSGTTLAKLSDTDYQKSNVAFSISGTPSPTTFYFWRKDSTSGVSYFIEPSGCTIVVIGTGLSSNPGSKDDYDTSGA